MSGSLVYRAYIPTIPAGQAFSLQIDESNARAEYNGQQLCPIGGLTGIMRPVSLKPRRVTCVSTTGNNLRRSFVVADLNVWQLIASDPLARITAPAAADNTDGSGGAPITWEVINAIAEKNTRRPRGGDSGLIDGSILG
jgi:hypothetical protein